MGNMGKKFLLLATLASALTANLMFFSISASNYESNININNANKRLLANRIGENSELGYGVDAVKGDLFDTTEIKTGADIFDRSWLNSQINNSVKINTSNTRAGGYSGSSYEEVSNKFSMGLNISSSATVDAIKLFQIGLSNSFQASISVDYNEYYEQFYYVYNSSYQSYTLNLPNYRNLNTYISNLSDSYLQDLNTLFSTGNYVNFFDKYGTHVIAKGIYGASFNFFYSLVSNSTDFSVNLKDDVNAGLNAAFAGLASGATNFDFNLESVIGTTSKSCHEFVNFYTQGGDMYAGLSYGDLGTKYPEWVNSVGNNEKLIGYSSDGLIPLWNLLPSNLSSKANIMKNWFKQYYQNNLNDVLDNYDPTESTTNTLSCSLKVRDSEATITDADQYWDIIPSGQIPFKYLDCVDKGYKYADVYVTMKIRKIDDGHQQLALTNSVNTYNYDDKEKYPHRNEPVAAQNNYYTFSFTSIPLSDISYYDKDFCIVLRYGASGDYSDNWVSSDVTMNITLRK